MNSYTTHPSVNEILNTLLDNFFDILGDQFIGMYLHGSLAIDDFVSDRSDIDLVIVTKNFLSTDKLDRLKAMHQKITSGNSPYAKRIECIYIPIESLKNYVQEKSYFPCLHVGGEFHTDGFGIIEKHVLREKGITIKGPDPKSFIKPVFPDELKKAASESLRVWWFPKLKDHTRLKEDDYQVYAILTMCRSLYTIKMGDIVSKSAAARLAIDYLDEKWSKLINKALIWKIGDKFNHLEETLSFIKYTLDHTINNLREKII